MMMMMIVLLIQKDNKKTPEKNEEKREIIIKNAEFVQSPRFTECFLLVPASVVVVTVIVILFFFPCLPLFLPVFSNCWMSKYGDGTTTIPCVIIVYLAGEG